MQQYARFTLLLIQTIVLFGNTAALPLGALRLYLDSVPTESDTLPNLPTADNSLVLLEEEEPILVYIPETSDSDFLFKSRHSSRSRRALSSDINPATSPINYQQVWPVLNAAKDRAVELADEGQRRKGQGISKRQTLEAPEAGERLTRYSRNLPDGQEKMFQIQTVGDLPMFRFG